MENYQKNLIGHALLVLIIGLLAGFMLAFSLIGGLEIVPSIFMGIPVFGTTEGWVRAHSGGIVNALLMIAVAFALPHCGLAPGVWRFMPKALCLPVGPIRYFIGSAMHQQIAPCHFPTMRWAQPIFSAHSVIWWR